MSVISFGSTTEAKSANWAHVYVVHKNQKRLEFEMLAVEADPLKPLVGVRNQVHYGTTQHFLGKLVSLEPCQSTAPELQLASGLPTLKGVVEIEA